MISEGLKAESDVSVDRESQRVIVHWGERDHGFIACGSDPVFFVMFR